MNGEHKNIPVVIARRAPDRARKGYFATDQVAKYQVLLLG